MTSLLSAEARKQVTEALEQVWHTLPSLSPAHTKLEHAITMLASLPEAPAVEAAPLAWGITYMGGLMPTTYANETDARKEFKRRNTVYADSAEHRTLVPLYASPQVQGEVSDARRWQELRRLFANAKTSASQNVLDALGLSDADPTDDLSVIIDAAIAARQGREDGK